MAIAAVPAVVGIVLGRTPFLMAGVPAAGLVGALLGPSIRAREPIAGFVVAMASLTILVADVVVVVWGLLEPGFLARASADVAKLLFGIVYIGLFGLVIVGLPMLVVTTPCAIVWAFVVRRLVEGGCGVAAR